MIDVVQLTGAKTNRPCFARTDDIQAAFVHSEFNECTVVVLRGGVTMHVKQTPKDIMDLMHLPVDPEISG